MKAKFDALDNFITVISSLGLIIFVWVAINSYIEKISIELPVVLFGSFLVLLLLNIMKGIEKVSLKEKITTLEKT